MAGRGTGLVSSAARVSFGERLLSGAFRGCCLMMRAAARCCGAASGEETRGSQNGAVDFQALTLLGYAPLGEIAAAQRELHSWQNLGSSTEEPPVAASILRLPVNRAPTARVASARERARRSARLSHGRA
jgi:hypothetical protein